MLSFENTEIAFKSKTNARLRKDYWLFKLMASPPVVSFGKHTINVALKWHLPLSWILKPTLFNHFCGGETLAEASKTVSFLNRSGVKTILDYSVEGTETDESYEKAFREILSTVKFAANNADVPFAVFKPSALCSRTVLEKASNSSVESVKEQRELDNFKNYIDALCCEAHAASVPIMVDAEHSYYQGIIDEVCEQMMLRYNKEKAIVFNTLQMYRTDRLAFLQKLIKKAISENFYVGIKFVRGAYMEKERERALRLGYASPIHSNKAVTDHAYNEALHLSVKHIDRIDIFNGTHNEASSVLLTELIYDAGLAKNYQKIWFSQLFGMSDNISYNLASEGYNVAKYVPYGPLKHVLPYLIRRAEENTSVKGQTTRELAMINKELRRRNNNVRM